jgi:hypothetical protein
LARVGSGGLKSAAWLKATVSAGQLDWFTANAGVCAGLVFGRLICHSLGLLGVLLLWRMVCPSSCIMASCFENVGVHPALQNFLILIRLVDSDPNAGKRCALVVSTGKFVSAGVQCGWMPWLIHLVG